MPKDAIENFYLNTRGTAARVAQPAEAIAAAANARVPTAVASASAPVATYVNYLLLAPPEQKVPRPEAEAEPGQAHYYNARVPVAVASAPVAAYVNHLLLAPPEQKVPRPEAEAEAAQVPYADSPYRWANFR